MTPCCIHAAALEIKRISPQGSKAWGEAQWCILLVSLWIAFLLLLSPSSKCAWAPPCGEHIVRTCCVSGKLLMLQLVSDWAAVSVNFDSISVDLNLLHCAAARLLALVWLPTPAFIPPSCQTAAQNNPAGEAGWLGLQRGAEQRMDFTPTQRLLSQDTMLDVLQGHGSSSVPTPRRSRQQSHRTKRPKENRKFCCRPGCGRTGQWNGSEDQRGWTSETWKSIYRVWAQQNQLVLPESSIKTMKTMSAWIIWLFLPACWVSPPPSLKAAAGWKKSNASDRFALNSVYLEKTRQFKEIHIIKT